jgi:hypothetical protein
METATMELGTDNLSRPINSDHVQSATTSIEKLKLLASIDGPLQNHLNWILQDVEALKNRNEAMARNNDAQMQRIKVFATAFFDLFGAYLSEFIKEDVDTIIDDKLCDYVEESDVAMHIRDALNDNDTISDIVDDSVRAALDDLRIVRR